MSKQSKVLSGGLAVLLGGCGMEAGDEAASESEVVESQHSLVPGQNRYGVGETVHTSGAVDRSNPFFQTLGINQRTCETCHAPDQGWTFSSAAARRLFHTTQGLSPLFMIHDAGNRPDADLSTLDGRKAAFLDTTVDLGVIRFNRTIPATAEFTATEVVDPSGFSTTTSFFAFRRPSPTANESKVPATGWAGNPVAPFTSVATTT